jgi:hypothetical protein
MSKNYSGPTASGANLSGAKLSQMFSSSSENNNNFTGLTPKMKKLKMLFGETNANKLKKIQADEEAMFSISEKPLAQKTSLFIIECVLNGSNISTLPHFTITDCTACVGGNTINFADHFSKVNAIEINADRAKMLKNNISVICPKNNSNKIIIYQGDMIEIAPTLIQDILFVDPPWGGPDYWQKKEDTLCLTIRDKDLSLVCKELAGKSRFLVLKLPFNFAITKLKKECEEVWKFIELRGMGNSYRTGKIKFIIIIFESVSSL